MTSGLPKVQSSQNINTFFFSAIRFLLVYQTSATLLTGVFHYGEVPIGS
jgi:hypothetical protein